MSSGIQVEELLNRVGKKIFVKYYSEFRELAIHNVPNAVVVEKMSEAFTDKSKSSRTSKAKRIFVEGKQIEALRLIVESSHPSVRPLVGQASVFLQEEINRDVIENERLQTRGIPIKAGVPF